MKITIVSASLAALLTTLSVAPVVAHADAMAAKPAISGHYEWRYKARPGANKPQLPRYERVWVTDQMASTIPQSTGGYAAMPCSTQGQTNSNTHSNNS